MQRRCPETYSLVPHISRRTDLSRWYIFKGEGKVVPLSVRNDMLSRIHNGHVGIQGCLRRAKESLHFYTDQECIETLKISSEIVNLATYIKMNK